MAKFERGAHVCVCSLRRQVNMAKTKIIPLSDRVVIEPITNEKKTPGGIVLPDTVDKEKPEKGKVLEVGPGRLGLEGQRMPMSVKKGDIVLFTKYGPNEIEIDDKDYLIAKEEDVLAILEE